MPKVVKVLCLFVFIFFAFNLTAQTAKYQQTSDESAIVCFEAENYVAEDSPSDGYWDTTLTPGTYSGTSGMQALPDDEGFTVYKDFANIESAPYMEYTVNFVLAGKIYIWARACHTDGFDDSVWMGIDDVIGDDPVSYTSDEQSETDWYWIRYTMGGDTATMEVPSVGVHTIKVLMREPGFKLDKVVLTPDTSYHPEGVGPDETLATAIYNSGLECPKSFSLNQNYPNPFNPTTTISYELFSNGEVSLTVYDINGNVINNLISNKMQTAEVHTVKWNGTNNKGQHVTSGVYFYELTQGAQKVVKKMMLVR